ncbi:antibiotic biosynthesis monooxygenase [Gorillibacterium sp. CAU 1737]|uniref:antibiotic biosynthesis monooxygenase n=1 Tax=Gorillibacterium sp. CAU 1737 TaxID=3140362 RepID=UPI0032604ADE
MMIQTRTVTVKAGYAEKVIERFSGSMAVDGMEGLIDRTILVNRKKKDEEEVVMMIRWESIEAWKNWEKSDVHIQGHREKKEKPADDSILSVSVHMYDAVKIIPGKGSAAE